MTKQRDKRRPAKVRGLAYADKVRRAVGRVGLADLLDQALQGNDVALDTLLNRLPGQAWPQVAVAMHLLDTPNLPARRELVRLTWMRAAPLVGSGL
jgi:hypothetical protein